jgi:hypothetical protein
MNNIFNISNDNILNPNIMYECRISKISTGEILNIFFVDAIFLLLKNIKSYL